MKTLIATLLLALVAMAPARADELKKNPIKVEFRKALIGSGYVAKFTNKSDDTIRVHVIFTNDLDKKGKFTDLVLDAGKMKEVGHLQGYTVVPGDTVAVECPGYESKKVKLKVDD